MNLATIMSCSSDNDPKAAANKAKRVNLQLTNSQKKEYIMKGELEGMDKDCLPDISTVRKWDPYRIEAFNSLGFGGEKRIRCATKTEKVDKLAEQLELSGECQLAFRHHILVTEELPEKMNHGPVISSELPKSDEQSGVDDDIYVVVDRLDDDIYVVVDCANEELTSRRLKVRFNNNKEELKKKKRANEGNCKKVAQKQPKKQRQAKKQKQSKEKISTDIVCSKKGTNMLPLFI